MQIQHGLNQKTKVNAPNFHKAFGSIQTLPGDFNLDAGLTNFNQNNPNQVFGTPAMPEGCTGMTLADIATDYFKVMCSPFFEYTKTCLLENQPVGNPCDVVDVLKTPTVYGAQALGETTDQQALTRRMLGYSVNPIKGSLFQGIVSAMSTGAGSVAFAGTWYQSFEFPVNGVIPAPKGGTSGHMWKFCGLKTISGVPYLIAKPWLGPNWGDKGFCYFSESVLDSIGGQAFTFAPTTIQVPQVRYTVMGALLDFMRRLLLVEGGTEPETVWQHIQDEIKVVQGEVDLFINKVSMEETVYNQTKLAVQSGKHLTLNPVVPNKVGCAEAVSTILSRSGISDGPQGIEGTADLLAWLQKSSHMQEIQEPEAGAIIINATGTGNGSIEGHTGILGAFNTAFANDWGICSNDSATGFFLERWNLTRWQAYYRDAGGMPTHIFRPV